MSKSAVLQLIGAAENNPEILNKLQTVKGPEDVLAIASELGYEFSESELFDVMQEKQLSFSSNELSESELESIAGGKQDVTNSGQTMAFTKADAYTKNKKRRKR